MAEKGEALPYDKSDKQSIYHYALDLWGSTLRGKSDVEQVADIRRNKGSFGNAVEYYYFFIDNSSDSAPDFKEAGIELKTTPLKRSKDGSLSSKERLVIGMIDYMEVVNETFETSHMVEKAEDILLISCLWEPETDPLDYRIELVEMVDLKGLPEGDLAQIKDDWETVVDKVLDGRAHEISGSDTLYLEACTKAASSSVRRIRKPRERRHLTQKQLAEKAGLSESALRSYELGNRHPKDSHIKLIAQALEVRPEAFTDCRIRTSQEVIHLLFNLEENHGIVPIDGQAAVKGAGKHPAIVKALLDWGEAHSKLESGEISQDEYEIWKDSYSPYTRVI